MDRSFLSQPEVIAASRQFVCVRLATYENKDEAEFMEKLFVGRSGEVENTTFTLLSPDGTRPLVRVSREAAHVFESPADMADSMDRIAQEHGGRTTVADDKLSLPKVASIRLALNVAASDEVPLVVISAKDATALRGLEEKVRDLAWSDDFVGLFAYTTTTDAKDLAEVDGAAKAGGVMVIQPDQFGMTGRILAQAQADASPDELAKTLRTGAARHEQSGASLGEHVHQGTRKSVFWETPLPVTDPHEAQARQRNPGNPNK